MGENRDREGSGESKNQLAVTVSVPAVIIKNTVSPMSKRIATTITLALFIATLLPAQNLGGLLNKAKKVLSGEEPLTQEEIGNGLKEALNLGVEEAVTSLSTEDGYYESVYKILLPEEARLVVDKVKMVPGFQNVEQELILRINRAAEDAASKATPIFVDAIKQMTFQDAMNILMGERDAATRYLHRTTFDNLFGEFNPVIQSSLDEVNANEYWETVTVAYNKLPFVKKVETDLDGYVTGKALEGMFGLIEKKEEKIRDDVGARPSPLLQKVFAQQDN